MCSVSQSWGLDTRDALFDAVIESGSNEEFHVTLPRLYKLRKDGLALRVVDKQLLSHLVHALSDYENISKQVDAWTKFRSAFTPKSAALATAADVSPTPFLFTLPDLVQLVCTESALPRAKVLHTHQKTLLRFLEATKGLSESMREVIFRSEICSVRKARY